MANTQIQISGGGTGAYSVSPDSAPFNEGDTVTFVSVTTADAILCFSDEAAHVIQPKSHDQTPLAAGAGITFQVTGTAQPGAGVQVDQPGQGGSPEFPNAPAGTLQVTVASRKPVPPVDGNS
jgi:hypothetical protein